MSATPRMRHRWVSHGLLWGVRPRSSHRKSKFANMLFIMTLPLGNPQALIPPTNISHPKWQCFSSPKDPRCLAALRPRAHHFRALQARIRFDPPTFLES